ncbi:MAG: hypothetical protein NTW30_04390 [Candidatus Aenigmarchaeota archaeon]|nr:hypothetical protein [Candidatus Aenigmarchaeota archaeon]
MKEIEFQIKYKQLYFDDVIYVFQTLKNTTRNFFMEDKYWLEDDTYQFFLDNNIDIKKEDYYQVIPELKTIIRRGLTFEITEWEKGSLTIKATIAFGEALVPFVSVINLPSGITIAVLFKLMFDMYSKHEKEYDERIQRLLKNWKKTSKKRDREQRGIEYYMVRIR